jgi:2'-5' RNA ligase
MHELPRKRRLFVGIELDGGARRKCAGVSEELRRTGFAARYESPEKLHVTLAFLGFVERARSDEIVAALRDAARATQPFAVTLDKVGAFPHERKPRVVYVGAREQGAAFRALAKRVRSKYAELGFEFKNDAVAHVTIARVKESKRPLPLIELAPISVPLREIALFESLPDPANNTSRYEIIGNVTLSGVEG